MGTITPDCSPRDREPHHASRPRTRDQEVPRREGCEARHRGGRCNGSSTNGRLSRHNSGNSRVRMLTAKTTKQRELTGGGIGISSSSLKRFGSRIVSACSKKICDGREQTRCRRRWREETDVQRPAVAEGNQVRACHHVQEQPRAQKRVIRIEN